MLTPKMKVENNGDMRPILIFEFNLMRNYTWFLYNFIMISGLIATLGFCTFGTPQSEFADRCAGTFTLLLTLIAQKLAIAEVVPRTSKSTVLDKYLFSCFLLLVAIIIEQTLIEYLSEDATAHGDEKEA